MAISIPTLSAADNADGTGGVATISNGDAPSTHEVFVQSVNGELGTATWISKGSRLGNGTVNIAAASGYYWIKLEASNGSESVTGNLVYANFTSGDEAVLYQCLAAARSRVQGLSLPGIANGSVIVRKVPDDKNIMKPCVVIAPLGRENLDATDGTNNRDDVGYAVLLAFLDGDNQNQTSNHNRNLLWREKVRQAFHNQRLPGVDSIINTVVEPLSVTDAAAWFERNTFVSTMILRFISREPRGI